MLLGGVLVLFLGAGAATAIFMLALGGGLTIGAAVPSALAGSLKPTRDQHQSPTT
jgi:hypothetical protein